MTPLFLIGAFIAWALAWLFVRWLVRDVKAQRRGSGKDIEPDKPWPRPPAKHLIPGELGGRKEDPPEDGIGGGL